MATALLYPYVTLDDVKDYCNIGESDVSHDELIRRNINKASRYIDRQTRRYYYKKIYVSEYLNGTKDYQGWQTIKVDVGGLLLTPQMAPVIDITSIAEDSAALTENTDYFIHKENGIIEKASGNWNEEPRKILITCNLGYDTDDTATPSADIPGDIAQYAREIASRFSGLYKKAIKNYVSGAAETVDLFGVPKEIDQALINLRPISIF